MSNKQLPKGNSKRPIMSSEEEIRTLLLRLLELVASRVVEKLQQCNSAGSGEKSLKRLNPGSSNRKGEH
jgi:hypothetical protein